MRIRVTFSKTGALRYIGHLDLKTVWERALRRAALPLAYSQGFHPQPRINLASALPLGFTSRCELIDLRMEQDLDLESLPGRLQAVMSAGIEILKVEGVDERAPALQTRIVSAVYEVTLEPAAAPPDLEGRLSGILRSPALPRRRRDKEYDLRPLIEGLSLEPGPSDARNAPVIIRLQLAAREGATGRPEEVLAVLGIPFEEAHVERTGLLFRE